MRANTQKIYDRLIRGGFLAVDTIDSDLRHLYEDVDENFDDYQSYFRELGLTLSKGDGYFYFSRAKESRLTIEQKLQSFAQWVDIIDFLRTFNINFAPGFQFRSTQILEQINLDVELREKALKLFRKLNTHQEIVDKLMADLLNMGFIELVNEQDSTYKVTSAFNYADDIVDLINIYNEEE